MDLTALVVTKDEAFRSSLQKALNRIGHEVIFASTRSQAKAIIQGRRVGLVLVDIDLRDGCGLHLVSDLRARDARLPVILTNGKTGGGWTCPLGTRIAHDYITRPLDAGILRLSIGRALGACKARRLGRAVKGEPCDRLEEMEILGKSPAIRRVREEIRRLAAMDRPVLVIGETGTGKQLAAEALHSLSRRAGGPFVQENCGSFTDGLLRSELFGHERGSFTGAVRPHRGLLEMAEGGILFLDEISEMKPGLQAALLHVLEGRPFMRVGGERKIRPDVRIITATNRDPRVAIEEGTLREDLFHRIGRLQIVLPPLRERGWDVILLARHFLRQTCVDLGTERKRLTRGAKRVLLEQRWPGNVRQLLGVIDSAAVMSDSEQIGVASIQRAIEATELASPGGGQCPGAFSRLDEVESWHIRRVLEEVGGDQTKAARILGVHRNTLRSKLKSQEEGPATA